MSLRYLSISQLSDITGKDRRTVSKRVAGLKPHSTKGNAQLYEAPPAIEAIFLSDSVEGMDKKLLRVELAVEEERLQKLQIENGKALGRLVPIEDVAKEVEKEYAFVRAQIRSLPSKLAKPLSMISDPHEVFSRLSDSVDECLAELTADVKYENERAELESITKQAEASPSQVTDAVASSEPSGMGRPVPLPVLGVEQPAGPLED